MIPGWRLAPIEHMLVYYTGGIDSLFEPWSFERPRGLLA